MATSILTVVFEVEQDPAAFADARLSDDASRPREAMNKLAKLVGEMASKHTRGEVTTHLLSGTNRTHSSGTLTFTGAGSENDAFTLGAEQFLLKASPSGENQVDIGADATGTATNVAAAINAHSGLKGVVTASSSAGVVTITALVPGLVGSQLTFTEDTDAGGVIAISGSGALSGFTGSEQQAVKRFACGL